MQQEVVNLLRPFYEQIIRAVVVTHTCQTFTSLEPSLIEPREGKPAGSNETDVSEDQASAVSAQELVGGH